VKSEVHPVQNEDNAVNTIDGKYDDDKDEILFVLAKLTQEGGLGSGPRRRL
jgi:hypothetical protein